MAVDDEGDTRNRATVALTRIPRMRALADERQTAAFDPAELRSLVGVTRGPRSASPTRPIDERHLLTVTGSTPASPLSPVAAPSPSRTTPRARARVVALDPKVLSGETSLARGSDGVRASQVRPVAPASAAAPARRYAMFAVVAVLGAVLGAAVTYFY